MRQRNRTFDEWIAIFEQIAEDEGTINIPQRETRIIDGEEVKAGAWLHARRTEKRRGLLDGFKTAALESLGIEWEQGTQADSGQWLSSLVEFDGEAPKTNEEKAEVLAEMLRRGLRVTQRTTAVFAGQKWSAGRYLDLLRRKYREGTLDEATITRIQSAGGSLGSAPTRFDMNIERLRQAIAQTGRTYFSQTETVDLLEGPWKIGNFICEAQQQVKNGSMSEDRKSKLKATGIRLWAGDNSALIGA